MPVRAELRSQHIGLRAMDALQLASALHAGCALFVTNDLRLPDVDGLRLVKLAGARPSA